MSHKRRLLFGLLALIVITAMLTVFFAFNNRPSGPGLANPASTYCIEHGGKLEIRSQTGVCVFPNGSECEEWAFFRKECAPK